jgi:dTDP-4-amino-4,6-dideoxygalactose transaminase
LNIKEKKMPANIPFVDLRAQHEQVRLEIEASIADIINRSSFIGGVRSNFERQFAEFLGVREVIGVANGTDALWLALMTAGVKPGEAVITVPNTFIATVEAITRCNAYPLFVDIDLPTANMDVNQLRRLLETGCRREDDGRLVHLASGRRVAAILPVHLYGLPVDLAPMLGWLILWHSTDRRRLPGSRRALQAQRWKRRRGLAAGFSSTPAKYGRHG